jgi:hypothetical protein
MFLEAMHAGRMAVLQQQLPGNAKKLPTHVMQCACKSELATPSS